VRLPGAVSPDPGNLTQESAAGSAAEIATVELTVADTEPEPRWRAREWLRRGL